MPTDLKSILPGLLPRAISWVERQSEQILESGLSLSDEELRLAAAVGVAHPEKVRIQLVPRLPLPGDPELRALALETGLLGSGAIGVTFGHGIYICDGHRTNRVVSHECRHVYQYESAGSIGAFLSVYLEQIATVGYHDAPLEVDARAHEIS